MKKVSLRDIAEELGVSKTLVSLVLNGKAEENRISPEIIEKVKKVAEEKGYKPNSFARALRTGRSHTIGLIVADISNPFFARMARSIEDEAFDTDYTVLFGSSDEDIKKAERLIKTMLDRQIEGLIISPTLGGESNIELIEKNNIPYVLVDRTIKGANGSSVSVNNLEASFEAVSQLIEEGCQKIAHITFNQELTNLNDRYKGYLKAHEVNGIEVDSSLIKSVSSDRADDEIIAHLEYVSSTADAYFFANNEISVIALQHLRRSGKTIGKDVIVTCFDDHEAFHLLDGSIRVITQPVIKIGEKALEILLKNIGEDLKESQQIVLPTKYTVINQHLLKKQH